MDRTMLRIGAMNMMLHGVDNPNIEYKDSLSEANTDKDKFSLVLANPPFKGSLDYEQVSADLLKVTKTKKTELLFLALFLRILKTGGRCASIVPDGVLFGSTKCHKDIRKEIVENHKLMDIKIIRHENGKGKKAEAIVKQMIAENSTEADVIAGATMSSKVIRAALIDALKEGIEQK